MKISIYRTLTESLGFGWRNFEHVARISWMPLLLLTLFGFLIPYIYFSLLTGGPVTISDISPAEAYQLLARNGSRLWNENYWTMFSMQWGISIINVILISSFFVSLLRYGARGTPLPGTSFPVAFGFKHLRFIGAAVLSGLGLFLLLVLPMERAVVAMSDYVSELLEKKVYVFPFEDSLHTVSEEPLIKERGFWQGLPNIVQIPFIVGLVYFGMRLFAYPVFVAAHEKGDQYSALKEVWKLTNGLNILRVSFAAFFLFVVFNGFHWFGVDVPGIVDILNKVIFPAILIAINYGFMLIASSTRVVAEDSAVASWVLPIFSLLWTLFRMGLNFAYLFLFYGVFAGFGASLYRQRMDAIGK